MSRSATVREFNAPRFRIPKGNESRSSRTADGLRPSDSRGRLSLHFAFFVICCSPTLGHHSHREH
jgi:hypothetical protein